MQQLNMVIQRKKVTEDEEDYVRGRVARSSKKAFQGEAEGARRGARSRPGGNRQGNPGGRKGCARGLEARQGLGGPGSGRSPRLRPTSGGAPGPASLRFRPGGRAHGPDWRRPALAPHVRGLGFRSQRPPPLPQALRSCSGTPGSLPSRTLTPAPPPRLPPTAFTCSRSGQTASRPGPRRQECDAAPRVRSPFPPPPLRSPTRRRAGEQRRPRWGDAGRAAGGETLPLSVRPGKSSLAAASRERAGGRPNGEGSRGVGNGCHVAQVDRGPPPPPPPSTPARSLPRPLVRSGAPLGRVGPPREADPGDPCRGRSRLSRSLR
ncbi:uncharacterized protein LOC116148071 [Camelus dromedarius]|uniref:uncharacterized protein LOC116148071 n=1 Tax=Camelus dromedarius TaxID=9838 RepID=UPI00311A0D7F